MSQDPKITRVIDSAARFISKNGLFHEKEILAMPNNERFSFLNSSDPLHGVYKQKLTEYKNRPNDGDAPNDDDDVANISSEIIEPPPGAIKNLLENTALYVSKYGLEEEKSIMEFNEGKERYNFMKRSDLLHAYYKHKVAEYQRERSQGEGDASHNSDDDDDGEAWDIPTPTYLNLPNFMLFILPKGMSEDEFDTITGWYGREYSKVLPPTGLKQELAKNDAFLALILDRFLLRLKWNALQNQQWHEGGEKAMIAWHASVTNDFALLGSKETQV